jgi:hypothetical protein
MKVYYQILEQFCSWPGDCLVKEYCKILERFPGLRSNNRVLSDLGMASHLEAGWKPNIIRSWKAPLPGV